MRAGNTKSVGLLHKTALFAVATHTYSEGKQSLARTIDVKKTLFTFFYICHVF